MANISISNKEPFSKQVSNGMRYSLVIVFSFFSYAATAIAAYWVLIMWTSSGDQIGDFLLGVLGVAIASASAAAGLVFALLAKRESKSQGKVNIWLLKFSMIIDGLAILASLLRIFRNS